MKKLKKTGKALLVTLLACGLTGCSLQDLSKLSLMDLLDPLHLLHEKKEEEKKPDPDPQEQEVTVTLNKTTATLEEGQTLQLTATVTGSEEAKTWTVESGVGVVTVSESGLVTAVTAGSATVKVSVGEKSATCSITVTAPEEDEKIVNRVTVSGTKTVKVGKTVQLTATVSQDGGAPTTVTWKSENESVATVDTNGLVTGVSAGKATIVATSTFDTTKSGSIEITVEKLEWPAADKAMMLNTLGFEVPYFVIPSGMAWSDAYFEEYGCINLQGGGNLVSEVMAAMAENPEFGEPQQNDDEGLIFYQYEVDLGEEVGSLTLQLYSINNTTSLDVYFNVPLLKAWPAEEIAQGLTTIGLDVANVIPAMEGENLVYDVFATQLTTGESVVWIYVIDLEGNDEQCISVYDYGEVLEKSGFYEVEDYEGILYANALDESHTIIVQEDSQYYGIDVIIMDYFDDGSVDEWPADQIAAGLTQIGLDVPSEIPALEGEYLEYQVYATELTTGESVVWIYVFDLAGSEEGCIEPEDYAVILEQTGLYNIVISDYGIVFANAKDHSHTVIVQPDSEYYGLDIIIMEYTPDVGLEIKEQGILLAVGETLELTVYTGMDNPEGTIEFTSSEEAVATVDEQGVITAVGEGTAVITATLGELTATTTVTVVAEIATEFTPDQLAEFRHIHDVEGLEIPFDPHFTDVMWDEEYQCVSVTGMEIDTATFVEYYYALTDAGWVETTEFDLMVEFCSVLGGMTTEEAFEFCLNYGMVPTFEHEVVVDETTTYWIKADLYCVNEGYYSASGMVEVDVYDDTMYTLEPVGYVFEEFLLSEEIETTATLPLIEGSHYSASYSEADAEYEIEASFSEVVYDCELDAAHVKAALELAGFTVEVTHVDATEEDPAYDCIDGVSNDGALVIETLLSENTLMISITAAPEAEVVGATFNFETLQDTSGEMNGIAFTTQQAGGQSAPAYNSGRSELRLYAKNTITFTSEETLTSIFFSANTCGEEKAIGSLVSATTGTITAVEGGFLWEGEANEVTITASDSGQVHINSIEVNGGGSGGGEVIEREAWTEEEKAMMADTIGIELPFFALPGQLEWTDFYYSDYGCLSAEASGSFVEETVMALNASEDYTYLGQGSNGAYVFSAEVEGYNIQLQVYESYGYTSVDVYATKAVDNIEELLTGVEQIAKGITSKYFDKDINQVTVSHDYEDETADVQVVDYSSYGFIFSEVVVPTGGVEATDVAAMKAALPEGATLDEEATYEESGYHDIWYTYGDYSINIYWSSSYVSFSVIPTEMVDTYIQMMYS